MLQGFTQRLRFQRRLYGINTVCFFRLMVSIVCKLNSFFAKFLNI